MYSQTLKKKKLSHIITRSLIFFALFCILLYPACAGGLDSISQINPVNPESNNSSRNSESSTFYYHDAKGNPANISLSLQIATLNPEFQDYLKNPKNWRSQHYGKNGKLITLGVIPSPTSIYWPDNYTYGPDPELSPSYFPQLSYPQSAGEYPNESYFSLLDAGRVTPVKDQGSAGSCGIFASFASLDSYLIPIDSYQWDFSENNMKNLLSKDYPEGFDRTHDAGAGSHMATAYLTRWTGPILESDDPYNPGSGVSPTNKTVQKHVQEVFFLPPRNNSTDSGLIKKTIKEKGGIWAAYDVNWNCFGSKNGYDYVTYYNPALVSSSSPNGHAICIVGWDDNFSRYEFTSTPPGNGAFICKNSWGTGTGINGSGYFYISYYDANLGMENSIWSELCVFEAESPNNYQKIYQYDPLGWTTEYGYNNLKYAWVANVFKANSSENLKAIGFYTPIPDVNYEVHIYRAPSSPPAGGTEVYNSTGIFEFPGYHTIPIEQVIPLSTGQNFSIVVKISSESNIKFPAEYNFDNYSSKASAHPGESYISLDGTSWEDVTKYSSTTNFCVKAYTSAPDTQAPVINSVTLNNTTPKTGDLIRVSVNAIDNVSVTSVETSGSQLTYLSGNLWQGTITAVAGTHSVNVSAKDAAGNVAWNNSTRYTATAHDTQPPAINSVSLNNTTPKTGNSIRVTVNATDNINVTSVTASGSQLTYSSGNLWQETITAVSGTHSVNVSARDAAGNIAWNNSTSYTAITPDTQAPVINSVSLNNTTPKTGNLIRVSVNATDNVAVNSVGASGNQLTSFGGNLWQGTITAVAGTHSVNISARDTAGNIAWNNSTSYTAITPDTQAPVIKSVSLNNTTPKTGNLIRVTVNATDNVAVNSVGASGNQLTSFGGNLWQGTIIAVAGTHSVNISARDTAGNIAWNNSTSYTATKQDTGPVKNGLVIYYDGNLSGNSLVDLSGTNNTGYATSVTQGINQSTGARYVNLNGVNSKINIPKSAQTNVSSPMSVEFIGSINAFSKYGVLASKYNALSGWYLSCSPNAPYNKARFCAVMRNGIRYGYNSNISLVAGKVYDIVATYDNNVAHIYVNGMDSASPQVWNSQIAWNAYNITLGSGYYLNYGNCSMYTFRLYNRSLSAAEVLQNYESDRWRYKT
jgi:C1A family cysteine protease